MRIPLTPRALWLALLMLAGGGPAAQAGWPVCGHPDILEVVSDRLQAMEYGTRLDLRTLAQEPTARGNVVQCRLGTWVMFYDTARLGPWPAYRWQVHAYVVETLPFGFRLLSVE
jgi:hypothetical protein